jgi:O-acetyl-ADP-ribose deacetylase (regulator of RNase III)
LAAQERERKRKIGKWAKKPWSARRDSPRSRAAGRPIGQTSPVQLQAVHGDITKFDVDAIVNAANTALRRGSGVCGAIFAAAGEQLDAACAAIGRCETGDAVATSGFNLPAKWIIHTVGPVWRGGMSDEATLLASCYRRSLQVADELGAGSIAFPAISTGVFGYPEGEAALLAVNTIRSTNTSVERVLLVAFDEDTYERYRSLIAQVT